MNEVEAFTSDEKPGVVLLREGRYSVQLDMLEVEALKSLNRKERRVFLARKRKVQRLR